MKLWTIKYFLDHRFFNIKNVDGRPKKTTRFNVMEIRETNSVEEGNGKGEGRR